MKKIPIPCTQDCLNRTPTCKFDGTCNKYSEYKKLKDEQWWEAHGQKAKDYNVTDYMIKKVSKRSQKRKGK